MGKLIIITGVIITMLGVLLTFANQIPMLNKLGHLPGDISLEGERFKVYIPIVSSILISVIITLVLRFIR